MNEFMYTAVIVLCMVSPLNQDMSGRLGNCIHPVKAMTYYTLSQCDFYMAQVRRRLSTRAGQEAIERIHKLPHMVEGRLKIKGKCEVNFFNSYLQCVDCES